MQLRGDLDGRRLVPREQAEEQLYARRSHEGQEIASSRSARPPSSPSSSSARASTAAGVARGLASNPNVFLRTKIEKELGISPDSGGAAFGDALAVGFTYLVAAIVPLWPYFFFARSTALVVSLVCTLVALFLVGVAKGRVTRLSLVRAGSAGRDHRLSQRRSRLRDRARRHEHRRLTGDRGCPDLARRHLAGRADAAPARADGRRQ